MPVTLFTHLTHAVWYMILSAEKYDPFPIHPGTPQLSPQVLIDGLRFFASVNSQVSYPLEQPRSSRVCMCDGSVPDVDWTSCTWGTHD